MDRYLDGGMSRDERTSFEKRLVFNGDLAEHRQLQREIDSTLDRVFAVPFPMELDVLDNVRLAAEAAVRAESRPRKSDLLWYAAAAALIFGVFFGGRGLIWYSVERPIERRYTKMVKLSESQTTGTLAAYLQEQRDGFKPLWKCDNSFDFAGQVQRQLGQGLTYRAMPKHCEFLGMSHGRAISPWTMYFMAKVYGEDVIVFIDHVSRDPGQKLNRPGYNLFKRQVGDLVLYELTPWRRSRLLEEFQAIELPATWMGEIAIP